jgi:cullin-associated NEDD8-dissociated protein 1
MHLNKRILHSEIHIVVPHTYLFSLLVVVTGNPYQDEGLQWNKCWNDANIITVRVGDSCPCIYRLNTGEVRRQFWCCGGQNHFDLSYWAFQKLAHPVYGLIAIEYRPVSCLTNQPLE